MEVNRGSNSSIRNKKQPPERERVTIMRTIHTLATSAVAMLGLVTFGTNLAQAGHPIGNGKDMGHGPVIKNKGTLGKDMGHGPVINTRGKDSKWDKDRYKD